MNTITTNVCDEYILKRCEEIMLDDENYQEQNKEIIEAEVNFKKSLTLEQKKEYDKMEELCMKSISYLAICVYRTCLSDIKEVKNQLSWL
jgi:hypothetical protein